MPTPAQKFEIASNLKITLDKKIAQRRALSKDIRLIVRDLDGVLQQTAQMDLDEQVIPERKRKEKRR